MTEQVPYRAAWVPDDPQRPWDEAAVLAVDWVEREAAEQQAAAVLVTNALRSGLSVPSLARFVARHQHTTPQADRSRVSPGTGPVLAYVPDAKALEFAAELARGSSLCVVEGSLTPLAGWAAEVGAIDLTGTLGPTEQLDPRVRDVLDSVHFFGGNNGWSGQHERDHARRHLVGLRDQGLLDPDVVHGFMLARGVSARGADRVREVAQRLLRP